MLGTAEQEESGTFTDIEDELEDCQFMYAATLCLFYIRALLILYDAVHKVCSRATRILAAAIIQERLLFLYAHLEVRHLFESGD